MRDGRAARILQEFGEPGGPAIRNRTKIGRDLQAACRAMLARFVPECGCGFQDGGCLTLATALRAWSGGALEIRAAYRIGRRRHADHMYASADGLCLDSDGVATEAEMVAKLDRFERPARRRRATPAPSRR